MPYRPHFRTVTCEETLSQEHSAVDTFGVVCAGTYTERPALLERWIALRQVPYAGRWRSTAVPSGSHSLVLAPVDIDQRRLPSYPQTTVNGERTTSVDLVEIALRRHQMGRAAGAILRGGPAPIIDQGDGFWMALSGALSPDMNMTLVSSGGAATVAGVLDRVTESGLPTLFMLAGECQSEVLAEPWERVGELPFMASSLTSDQLVSDPKVRRAGPDDGGAVCQVMAEAFSLAEDLMADVIGGILLDESGGNSIWLLVNDDLPVSAVLTSIVDDAVTVWCMSTPERFGRRGFGRTVLAHALLEARSAGATVGLLGATPAGKPLYDRTGWTTLETWRIFTSVDSTQFSG